MSENLILTTETVEQKTFIPWLATNEECIAFLKPAFFETVSAISYAPITTSFERQITRVFERLCKAYSEPHRKYHTLNHIGDMILQIQNLPMEPISKMVLSIATFYHDYVYDLKNYEYNEPLSALRWLSDSYVLEFKDETIQRIYCMILSTWYSKKVNPAEVIGYVLQDIDFAAMGYSLEDYKVINAKVILELGGPEPTPEFFEKRKAFLNSILAKEFIYNTEEYKNRYEEQARTNVTWELNNFNALYNINSK